MNRTEPICGCGHDRADHWEEWAYADGAPPAVTFCLLPECRCSGFWQPISAAEGLRIAAAVIAVVLVIMGVSIALGIRA